MTDQPAAAVEHDQAQLRRWLIWFKCRECGEDLYMHDPHYRRKQRRLCPVATKLFRSVHGFTADWRRHIWTQQELTEHECDCNSEAPVALHALGADVA